MTALDETEIFYFSATKLVELYKSKKLSPVEVANDVLGRIQTVNKFVNAFVKINEETAIIEARESEKRWVAGEPSGLLDGVPITIKDLLITKGSVTGRGSKATVNLAPETEDAPCVKNLRKNGVVFIGRTTTPEFGWKGVTDSPLTGITRNPWNTNKTPGGSSGGAAVAAALGMGALHIGTDGGGSVRIPAGFTGVFGLKPTASRIAVYPPSPFGTLSHVGPITRTVEDGALMMNVMALPDTRDWFALPPDNFDYRTGLSDLKTGLRIAYSEDLGYAKVDPEVAALVKKGVKVFEDLGAQVDQQDPGFDEPIECFNKIWYWGCHKMLAAYPKETWAEMDPGLLEIAEIGARYSLAVYSQAIDDREKLGRFMNIFHENHDLLLTPALAVPAFDVGLEHPEPGPGKRWAEWTPFSYPFNLTGQPAAVVPCGFTRAGLPVGLQIVGRRYSDNLVMQAAAAFEKIHPFEMPSTPINC